MAVKQCSNDRCRFTGGQLHWWGPGVGYMCDGCQSNYLRDLLTKSRDFVSNYRADQKIADHYRTVVMPLVRRLDMLEEEIIRLNKLNDLNVPASTLADRVRAVRKRHPNFSNPQIAREAGCTAQEAWRILNRRKRPVS